MLRIKSEIEADSKFNFLSLCPWMRVCRWHVSEKRAAFHLKETCHLTVISGSLFSRELFPESPTSSETRGVRAWGGDGGSTHEGGHRSRVPVDPQNWRGSQSRVQREISGLRLLARGHSSLKSTVVAEINLSAS